MIGRIESFLSFVMLPIIIDQYGACMINVYLVLLLSKEHTEVGSDSMKLINYYNMHNMYLNSPIKFHTSLSVDYL